MVVVLGILALVAVPALSGVINNSTGSVAENTAAGIARDANALAAFNSGADANVTTAPNIEAALCEVDFTDGGWGTEFDVANQIATISLTKNGTTESYQVVLSAGRAIVEEAVGSIEAGTLYSC